jgi:serine/threonine protein kinase
MRWADQLLDALEYLHSQKPAIIHRDIKPQNLKLTPRGEVILLDFGLAKGIVTHQSQVSQSIRGYTPNYASLEQIRGTGTDARSDIYSIGATMYHLLTGEMPQDALTRIAAILMGQPDPLKLVASMNPEVPAPVAQVIEKAMAPHPDQRFSSAAAMRQALRSAASARESAGLHRAQTLTDEPVKANAAAADPRPKSDNRALPPPPMMKAEAAQAVAPQGAANPADSQIPDHVIVLLDKVSQNKSRKAAQGKNSNGAQARNSNGKDVQLKAAPAPEVNGKIPPAKEVPSRDVQERNSRGRGARENDLRGNAPQENDLRPKPPSRKKDVRGKSFFLKKVQQEQKKKLAVMAKSSKSVKQILRKALSSNLALFVLIALTFSVGVYQAYRTWPKLFISARDLASTTSASIGGASSKAPATRVEALRYYLEIATSDDPTNQRTIRATGSAPLDVGAKFKFHFKPTERGYLYIIALGGNGVPQTFLTSQPMPSSGVTTNLSAAGGDYNFPDGGQWFMVQKDAENTPFTIIFSKTPLKDPAFLSSQAGRDLNAEEQQELMDWRRRYEANTPSLVAMKIGNQPFVSVQSAERAADEPVIFDVSIKRQ